MTWRGREATQVPECHIETHTQMRLDRRNVALETDNTFSYLLLQLSVAGSMLVPARQEIDLGTTNSVFGLGQEARAAGTVWPCEEA